MRKLWLPGLFYFDRFQIDKIIQSCLSVVVNCNKYVGKIPVVPDLEPDFPSPEVVIMFFVPSLFVDKIDGVRNQFSTALTSKSGARFFSRSAFSRRCRAVSFSDRISVRRHRGGTL